MEAGPAGAYRIIKFGGTSVEGPARLDVIADVVSERLRDGLRPVLVISAFRGVTDSLLATARAATSGSVRDETVRRLFRRHRDAVAGLAVDDEEADVLESLALERAQELDRLLHGIELVQECSRRTLDQVLSLGERLAAPIVAAGLRARGLDVELADSRRLVVTDDNFGAARPSLEATRRAVRAHFEDARPIRLVAGFVGGTEDGEITTLGRGGSDHSAAVLGVALDADEVEIWTDVDGVMSADPGVVPDAFPLPRLSYDELLELSHWGAKVMYAPAVRPLRDHGIPIVIRNARNPDFAGTRVGGSERTPPEASVRPGPVKGIACVPEVSLLTLEGYGIEWAPQVLERLFGALRRAETDSLLVCQASSEHAVCIAFVPDDLEAVRRCVLEEFRLEREAGLVREPRVESDLAIVAAVGEGMRHRPSVAGRLFSILGNHGINVCAIAQGSSELNISAVVQREAAGRAVQAIHDAFFHPEPKAARLYVAGMGRVGSALLDQLSAELSGEPLATRQRLRLAGVATTDRCLVRRDGIGLSDLRSDAGDMGQRWRSAIPPDEDALEHLVQAAVQDLHHPRIFVDCTGSRRPVEAYGRLLDAGVSLVCANKLGLCGTGSGPTQRGAPPGPRDRVFYETTVGAALPVVRTLSDLVRTGDRVLRIEGVLSGTLGHVLDRMDADMAFSVAVREAWERGYTEPDPRDDLDGTDVLRKLVILAREAGIPLEPEEVGVESLLPGDGWRDLGFEEFWERLHEVDGIVARRLRGLRSAGRRPSYLARVEGGRASIGLRSVSSTHPCWPLRGSDNLVAVTSIRYPETPLIVRGPGAGAEVAASAVLADILRARAEATEIRCPTSPIPREGSSWNVDSKPVAP